MVITKKISKNIYTKGNEKRFKWYVTKKNQLNTKEVMEREIKMYKTYLGKQYTKTCKIEQKQDSKGMYL